MRGTDTTHTNSYTNYCLPLQSVNCNGLVHRYRNHIPYRAVCSTGAAGTSIARTWRQRFSFASAAVVVRISTWCRCSGYVLKYRPPMKRGRCWRCSGSASSHCDNAVSPQRGNRRNDSGVVRTEEGLEGHQSRASVALVSAHGSKRNGVSGIRSYMYIPMTTQDIPGTRYFLSYTLVHININSIICHLTLYLVSSIRHVSIVNNMSLVKTRYPLLAFY